MDTKFLKDLASFCDSEFRSREHYFEQMIDIMPGHVYWKDVNGVYMGCNDNLADLADLPHKEVIGRNDYQLCWNATADQLVTNDRKVMTAAQTVAFEEVGHGPDGGKFIMISTKSPLRDAYGEIVGVLGVSIEINQINTLHQQLRDIRER